MENEEHYWFRAKRYGLGWGAPCSWEGWAVTIAFIVLLLCGIVLLKPYHDDALITGWGLLLVACLTAICWWKGEPLRWRWGKD